MPCIVSPPSTRPVFHPACQHRQSPSCVSKKYRTYSTKDGPEETPPCPIPGTTQQSPSRNRREEDSASAGRTKESSPCRGLSSGSVYNAAPYFAPIFSTSSHVVRTRS